MKRERRFPARLVMLFVLLAATLPFFGFDCMLGLVNENEAGLEIHIENLGKDPIHFSHGERHTRVNINDSKIVAQEIVPAPDGHAYDGGAALTMKRMDIDLGTLRISIHGEALEPGKVTKFFIKMNEPEYFKFVFTCDNPLVGLDYRRPGQGGP